MSAPTTTTSQYASTGRLRQAGDQLKQRVAHEARAAATTTRDQSHSRYAYTERAWQRPRREPQRWPGALRHAVDDRRRARRAPLKTGLLTSVIATGSWGLGALAEATLDTAGVYAMPGIAAVGAAVSTAVLLPRMARPQHPHPDVDMRERWPRGLAAEVASAVLASAVLTYWTGVCGPSWTIAAVGLIALVVLPARWWRAHPVGPRAEPVQPYPERQPAGTPTKTQPAAPVDRYAQRWGRHVAGQQGVLPGSEIVHTATVSTVEHYRIDLRPGYTYQAVSNAVSQLSSALGVNRTALTVRGPTSREPACTAHMEILTGEGVSEMRYYQGPSIEVDRKSGTAVNPARLGTGVGELRIPLWDGDGCRSVAVTGEKGSGKSACMNALVVDYLSTGLFNLAYVDPKGNSSTALRKRARLAFIGQEASVIAPMVLEMVTQARGTYAARTDQDVLLPRADQPGLLMVHDEFNAVASDTAARDIWSRMSNQSRAYGASTLFANQMQHESKWGNTSTRDALMQTLISFRIQSESDTLVPGLTYRPYDLPTDDHGKTIPGWSVCTSVSHPNSPALWDMLPRDDQRDDHPDAPYTIATAFDEFFDQPGLMEIEEQVLHEALGPANPDGTWIVGPSGTHSVPSRRDLQACTAGTARKGSTSRTTSTPGGDGLGVSMPTSADASEQSDELGPVEAEVYALIEAGTVRRAEIVEAAHATRSGVDRALPALKTRGLIESPRQGEYQTV